ncbi:MAG: lysozyme [Pseudomonadota bacterium]
MTRTLAISDTGLRLLKAFEGFRPEARTLATGIRVVGYGHRLEDGSPVQRMSREEAKEQLLDDLEPVEFFVNEEVHAPLTQGQYDALCSLAFNIGLDAFRTSDVVRALNNGRVLDAANGFDVWRKATVGGHTYVVDALMRRRTAEKSLFLRYEPAVPAPSALLAPQRDGFAPLGPTDDGLPRITPDGSGVIEGANLIDALPDPLDATLSVRSDDLDDLGVDPFEDLEDDEADDFLLLSEDDIIEASSFVQETQDEPVRLIDPGAPGETDAYPLRDDDADVVATNLESPSDDVQPPRSAISEAADTLGSRLDALLDSDNVSPDEDVADALPSSLLRSDETPNVNLESTDDAVMASDIVVLKPGTEDIATARSNLLSFPKRERVIPNMAINDAEPVADDSNNAEASDESTNTVIDDLAADDILRASRGRSDSAPTPEDPAQSAERYLKTHDTAPVTSDTGGGLWIPMALGAGLVGASAVFMGQGAGKLLAAWGPTAVVAAAITGGLTLLFAFYSLAKGRFA